VGTRSERIEASIGSSEKNGIGSREAHVGSRTQETFGVPECTMGEVEGGAEEGSIAHAPESARNSLRRNLEHYSCTTCAARGSGAVEISLMV
jgi:hypothetical protein